MPYLCQVTGTINNAHDLHTVRPESVKQQPAFDDKAPGIRRYVRTGYAHFRKVCQTRTPAFYAGNDIVSHSHPTVVGDPQPDIKQVLPGEPCITDDGQVSGFRLGKAFTARPLKFLEVEFPDIAAGNTVTPRVAKPAQLLLLFSVLLLKQTQGFAHNLT